MSQLIGKSLGSYRILEQIGVGGMATIYKAYQPGMDRYVAIKVLPHYLASDQQFVKRFRREAQAIAKLEHPHILPVFDYGEHDGITYIAMRYVEAGTLKERMAQGAMSLAEISRIISQVGSALDYAHRQGIIHRDIKPGNVLIDGQGNTYLTDFGLARIMESSQQFTASGVSVGTPAYMSPEQGKGIKVDHRSDIYALGVMLYEMVTGKVPYEAETPLAVLLKHITDPLPLPRKVKPDVPEPVELVILRALAKEPGDRFQSANELVQGLATAVRRSPSPDNQSTQPAAPALKPTPAKPAESTAEQVSLITRVQNTWQTPRGKTIMIGATAVILILFGFLLSQLNKTDVAITNANPAEPTVTIVAQSVETAVTATPPAPAPTESSNAAVSEPNPTTNPTSEPTATAIPLEPTSNWQDVAANLTWEQANDGSAFNRANVTAVTIDPQNPNSLFAATGADGSIGNGAGVYKSTDSGTTWTLSNNGLARAAVYGLYIDPVDSQIIYATTFGAGLYKSSDGGQNWQASNNGMDQLTGWWGGVSMFLFDPSDHTHLYHAGPTAGIYHSTNGGESWQFINYPGSFFISMAIDPRDGRHLFAGAQYFGEGMPAGGLYESTDGGLFWEPVARDINGMEEESVSHFSIAPHNPDILFAYLSSTNRLINSNDGGQNWHEVSIALFSKGVYDIAFDPANTASIYLAAENGLIHSSDSGTSWQSVGNPLESNINALAFADNRLYAGSSSVLWTDDGGQSWESAASNFGSVWLDLFADPTSGTLYAEDGRCNLYRSPDEGNTWEQLRSDACGLAIDRQNGTLYRQTQGVLIRSDDQGSSWASAGPSASPDRDNRHLFAHPQDGSILYSVQAGGWNPFIHRITVGEQAWQPISTVSHVPYGRIVMADDGQRMYIAGENAMDVSDDGGETWQVCTNELTQTGSPPAIALHPQDNDTLLLGQWGKGLIKSTDGCHNWQPVNIGLENLFINALVYDLQDSNVIYAGTDGGIYVSFDGGDSWNAANNGLGSQPIVYSLIANPANPGQIFATTPNGIFRMDVTMEETAVSPTDESPANISAQQTEQARAFAEPVLVAIADRPPLYNINNIGLPVGAGISGHSSQAEGEAGFISDEYFVKIYTGGAESHACYGGDTSAILPADFVLEIDGRFLPDTNPNQDDWQIQFRKWGFGGFYVLVLTQNGQISLNRFANSEGANLASHTGAPVLAEPEINRVQLIAKGSETAVYVNGEPVIYVDDSDYTDQYGAGTINLGICNLGESPREVRWDNLKVWDISDLE